MSNFLRKDLNLNQKWWHRLLSIIFYGLFIFCVFIVSKSAIFKDIRPVHEVQSSLTERMTSEIKSARELSEPWEVFYNGSPYWVNMFLFRFYGKWKYQWLAKEVYNNQDSTLDGLFCSKNLDTQINDLIKKTWISKFYIKEINNYLKPVSTNISIEYIKNNNVKCILIDSFWDENKFLNPWWVAQEYQNNYDFYKRTSFSSLLNILEIVTGIITIAVILAIPFSILILIYYKVILYVIYGNKKRKIK